MLYHMKDTKQRRDMERKLKIEKREKNRFTQKFPIAPGVKIASLVKAKCRVPVLTRGRKIER